MEIFHAIEKSFKDRRASGYLDQAFWLWRQRREELADLNGLDDLIRVCRAPEPASAPEKDRMLTALCAEACGPVKDEMAGLLLCWLFLPGLWNAVRDFRGRDESDREDLAADLLAGFWQAARRVTPATTPVAHHLLRGARREAVRSVTRAQAHACECELLEVVDSIPTTSSVGALDDTLLRAIRAGLFPASSIDILLATRETIAEVAQSHGLTIATAQQQRHRIRRRLAAWLSESDA